MGSPSRGEAHGGQSPVRLESPNKGGGGVVIPVPGDASRSFRTVIQLINAAFKRIGKYIGLDGKVTSKGFFGRLKMVFGPFGSVTHRSVPLFDGTSGDELLESIITVSTKNSMVMTGAATWDTSITLTSAAGSKDSWFRAYAATGDAYLALRTDNEEWYVLNEGDNLEFQNFTGGVTPFTILKDSATNTLVIDSGKVGVNTASPACPLHVDQSAAAGAVPVLTLDQGDDSEEMIEFIGTIGTGNALEAAAAKTLTTTHFIKVTIPGGLTRYIPCGTIA